MEKNKNMKTLLEYIEESLLMEAEDEKSEDEDEDDKKEDDLKNHPLFSYLFNASINKGANLSSLKLKPRSRICPTSGQSLILPPTY